MIFEGKYNSKMLRRDLTQRAYSIATEQPHIDRSLRGMHSKTCSINVKIDGHLLFSGGVCLLQYFHQKSLSHVSVAKSSAKKIETSTNKMENTLANTLRKCLDTSCCLSCIR